MKHKTDAIDESNRIINEHLKNGISEVDAKQCAITTVNLILSCIRFGTVTHSLYMRVLNYLQSVELTCH